MLYRNFSVTIIKWYLWLSVILSLLGFLRMFEIYNTAKFVRILLPLIMIPVGLWVVFFLGNRFRMNGLIRLMCFMTLYGLLIGLIRQNNSYYYIISDTATISFAMSIYFVYLQRSINIEKMRSFLSVICPVIFWVSVFITLVCYVMIFLFHVSLYTSFGDVLMLLPLSWFLAMKRYRWAFFALIAVFLGGKMGCILASIAILSLHLMVTKRMSLEKMFILCILVALVGSGVFYSMRNYQIPGGENPVSIVLAKAQFYNPYRSENKIENYGGGRASEVIYSLRKLRILPGGYLFGAGHGFVYDIVYRGFTFRDVHNCHFTPVSLVCKYGFVFTALFYLFLGIYFVRIYKVARYFGKDVLFLTMFYFCVGNLIVSFTAYSIFVVILFWFFFGILSHKAEKVYNDIKMQSHRINNGILKGSLQPQI